LDYQLPRDRSNWIELGLSIYAVLLLLLAIQHENWGLVIWSSLFSAGYAYIAGLGFQQSFNGRKPVSPAKEAMAISQSPNLGQD
jgi:hypothetical protein